MKALLISCASLMILAMPVVGQEQTEPKERPTTYDESAVASEQIDAALAKAKKENRRVLIQWGANWCGWCHLLHDKMASDGALRRKLMYEYDVVLVDIGDDGVKNRDLAKKYGATLKSVPYLTILDADGDLVINSQTEPFETTGDTPGHDADKLVAFLTEHQAPYLSAESVLNEGLVKAKAEKKRVFLHFGAPWCGWCHRLEDWMARPDVAPVLAKDFVDVKIDIDRTIGGEKLLTRYRQSDRGGIPWFVFLEPTGEPVVTSNGPDGNLGCPWTDEEMAAFKPVLRQAAQHLTDEQIDGLIASLKAQKKKVESGG